MRSRSLIQVEKKQAFGKTEFPIISAFEYDKMLAISLQRNGFLGEIA